MVFYVFVLEVLWRRFAQVRSELLERKYLTIPMYKFLNQIRHKLCDTRLISKVCSPNAFCAYIGHTERLFIDGVNRTSTENYKSQHTRSSLPTNEIDESANYSLKLVNHDYR